MVINKLLAFAETLYKQLDYAIDTDPQLIMEQVRRDDTLKLMELAMVLFSRVSPSVCDPNQITSNPLVKFDFQFIEQRRLTAKILTILVRDFEAIKHATNQTQKSHNQSDAPSPALLNVFKLSIQNLLLLYPVFSFFLDNLNRDNFDEVFD